MARPAAAPAPRGPVAPRAATAEDVPALVALVQSAYRGDASRAGWTTEAHLLEGQRTDAAALEELVRAPDGVVLVLDDAVPDDAVPDDAVPDDAVPDDAVPGGRLLACCHLERRGADADGPGDPHAYFGLFAVRPDAQGGGTGGALLAAAEREAVERWGVARVEMTVLAQRAELLAFYRRRGYRETGEARPFPYGDERFGRPLRDDLALLVLTRSVTASPAPASPAPA